MIDAKDVKARGVSADGRATEYDWRCGRCGCRGDVVDNFGGKAERVKDCPLFACGATNRIQMGVPR